ncbi:alpha/beta fold hydrolase [uncultured Thomasclavelia sp.]|uniref:alpha/beta fold hydrolase n=1 Tax=uncultured Thomasclavelia sp. TaxID=3025759 RepID=UPI0025F6EF43|nr:alpha/beta hydrolase [uncultured Thomasclavelia sp.]
MEIVVNGVKLYYQKIGHGKPLIMVHGNGEDHHIFDEAVTILKEKYTCYCLDSRGHGQSQIVDEYDYQIMADDVIALIQSLGLKDVYYYGFSDGGIIGLYVALKSNLIDKMVLSGTNYQVRGIKFWVRLLMRCEYLIKRDAKILMMLKQPHLTINELQQIQIPALIVAGSKDLIKYDHTRSLAKALKRGQLLIIPGENHGSYIIKSQKIAKILLDYLK